MFNFFKRKPKPESGPYSQAFDAIERYEGDKKELIKLLIKAFAPGYNLHQNPPKGARIPKPEITD